MILELLEPAFGGSVPDDVATMLTDRTEGRPWQTLEAIDLLAKSGVLDQPASEHIPDEIAAAVDEAAKAAERAAPTFLKAGYLTDAVAMDAEVTDEIGVHADVDALARLMVDRDVHPPLSIGLFGDWARARATSCGSCSSVSRSSRKFCSRPGRGRRVLHQGTSDHVQRVALRG